MTSTITRRKEVNAETGSEPSHEKPGSEMMEELFFFLTYTNNNNKKKQVSIHVMTANTSKTTAGKLIQKHHETGRIVAC